VFLLDYEQAHPEDITGDSCAICGGGEDVADDWISCDVSSEPNQRACLRGNSGSTCWAYAVHSKKRCTERADWVANWAQMSSCCLMAEGWPPSQLCDDTCV